MIRIIIDSSSDYSLEELERKNLELVSITINICGNSYHDIKDINRDDFYNMLVTSGEFPMTSQPSPQEFLDIFKDAKKKGDSIIVIALSSALSGTFQSATLAKNMADYDEIYLIDSLSATHGIRHMVEYAIKLRDQGMNAADIASAVEAMKSKVKILAGVDTLEYLCKGGRLSKAAAAIGELANLKPIITVTEEGSVAVAGKALGRNKAIITIVKAIQSAQINSDFPVYSVYAYGTENTEKLEEKLENAGIHVDEMHQIGATIGTHVGPGAFGIIYVEK